MTYEEWVAKVSHAADERRADNADALADVRASAKAGTLKGVKVA